MKTWMPSGFVTLITNMENKLFPHSIVTGLTVALVVGYAMIPKYLIKSVCTIHL